MEIIITIITILAVVYVLSVRGRRNHSGLAELRKWKYAHRGLHNTERPENSMSAFKAALDSGYGIELDLHLLSDGNLGVMHDSSLKRTAGADVRMEELTTADLSKYHLGGTEETIPEFRQVLELFDGKAPLIVELKPDSKNHFALAEAACKMLEDYKGPYCIESFDPRCIWWLKKHRPDIIRGQLAEDYFKTKNTPLPWILKFVLGNHLENFLTNPDFVAYRFSDRKKLSNFLVRKLWRVQGVSWTLQNQEEFDTAVSEGWIPIFEGFEP